MKSGRHKRIVSEEIVKQIMVSILESRQQYYRNSRVYQLKREEETNEYGKRPKYKFRSRLDNRTAFGSAGTLEAVLKPSQKGI